MPESSQQLPHVVLDHVKDQRRFRDKIHVMLLEGDSEHLTALIRATGQIQMEDMIAEAYRLMYALTTKIKLLKQGFPPSDIWIDISLLSSIKTIESATQSLYLVEKSTKLLKQCLYERKQSKLILCAETRNDRWNLQVLFYLLFIISFDTFCFLCRIRQFLD